MLLAERIQVRKTPNLSALCHRAKNLYNLANYYVRQELFHLGSVLTYYDLDFMLHGQPAYQALPAQSAQQVLRQVAGDWKSFFASCKSYRQNSERFFGTPRPPHYRPKDGENVVFFTNQQCRITGGWLQFPYKSALSPVRTRIMRFHQVRVIPMGCYYVIEIVYEVKMTDLGLDKRRALGIDLGVANLVTAVNNVGISPFAIRGGAAKSVNQFYNKQLARFRSAAIKTNNLEITKRIQHLVRSRTNKISDIFHKASRVVINFCIKHRIGMIVIGHNPRWKQRCRLGRQNNQAFVYLPFNALIQQIRYKAELAGITVVLVDERYTSLCSFLDSETLGWHTQYAGKRTKRGLFRARSGVIINADVNAASNILLQGVPEAFADGIEDVGLHPVLFELS